MPSPYRSRTFCRQAWPVPRLAVCDADAPARGSAILDDHRGPLRTVDTTGRSWFTWTSRRSAGSPTAVAGVPTAARWVIPGEEEARTRIRTTCTPSSTITSRFGPIRRSSTTNKVRPRAFFELRDSLVPPDMASDVDRGRLTDNAWNYTLSSNRATSCCADSETRSTCPIACRDWHSLAERDKVERQPRPCKPNGHTDALRVETPKPPSRCTLAEGLHHSTPPQRPRRTSRRISRLSPT